MERLAGIWDRFRIWLICKLAGQDAVAVNCTIHGGIVGSEGQRVITRRCEIWGNRTATAAITIPAFTTWGGGTGNV